MKRFFFVLVLVVAGIAGLGLSQGWFHIGSDRADGKSNVTLSMDTDKFQKDSKTAVADMKDVGRQIKDKVAGPGEKSMDGTVVSVTGNKLTMTNKEGKEHSHTLAANVTVTCDGKTCTVADLKAGMRIRVTTDTADRQAATRIEALDKDIAFASSSHDGKAVSITGDKLVMTNMDGAQEHTYTLAADIKVTCDGKVCKVVDLKPGMRVRVTTEIAEPNAATRIEALDNNRSFEKGA
jgi:GH24 family phage-related lysozyme (muramidase)